MSKRSNIRWSKSDNQELAKHLAYIGSMNDANIDFNDLAYELIGELAQKYPHLLIISLREWYEKKWICALSNNPNFW